MKITRLPIPLLLLCLLSLAACTDMAGPADTDLAATHEALNGFEGTYEYALDAPWRMEPYTNRLTGQIEYEPIPILLNIYDAYAWEDDNCYLPGMLGCTDVPMWLGDACSAKVTAYDEGGDPIPGSVAEFSFEQFAEVELTGLDPSGEGIPYWPFDADEGDIPWQGVCRPAAGQDCSFFRTIKDTSEWHARIDYDRFDQGQVVLKVELMVSKNVGECADQDPDLITFTNWVSVTFAPAPLPRFGDDRWLYGDLHYHAQGTDNVAESAYSFRGVIRAMGAMGLDFVFATDHASNSKQIADMDIDLITGGLDFSDTRFRGLRDLSADRFEFNIADLLWGPEGANTEMQADWAPTRQRVPQIYQAAEVDVIPEIDARPAFSHNEPPVATTPPWPGETEAEWFVEYGNGWTFDLLGMCEGWHKGLDLEFDSCPGKIVPPGDHLFPPNGEDGFFVRDVQGINDLHFARQHVLHLPYSPNLPDAFVPSSTSRWGGATRRLIGAEGAADPGVAPAIHPSGIAFLAHPLSHGGGGEGPGSIPYTRYQLERVMEQESILGLQFWNEDTRLSTKKHKTCTPPLGPGGQPDFSDPDYQDCVEDNETNDWDEDGISHLDAPWSNGTGGRPGWMEGNYRLVPQYQLYQWAWQNVEDGVDHKLHHGAATWDRMLRWGLDAGRTAAIGWLPPGEPRKVFAAGGSDAHGDLNYRREGYVFATDGITDTTLGKVRNLVFAGQPQPECDPTGLACLPGQETGRVVQSQQQVTRAIAQGELTVTDGPALRIVLDKNGNGEIDDGDIPMGATVDLYGDEPLPLLVEWESTPEFGPVMAVDFYIGVDTSINNCNDDVCPPQIPPDETRARTYAPEDHGVRRTSVTDDHPADPESGICASDEPCLMLDNYWHPGRNTQAGRDLRIDLAYLREQGLIDAATLYHGTQRIDFDLRDYPLAGGRAGNRFYVRAFARTAPSDPDCAPQADDADRDLARHQGRCIRRYAFTNPVWSLAIAWQPGEPCEFDPRSIDRDGDGYPDVCDAFPNVPCDPESWSENFGGASLDYAQAVTFDDQGNLIVAGSFQSLAAFASSGYTMSADGAYDVFVAKFSPQKELLWHKQFGGSGNVRVGGIAAGPDGSIALTGWFVGEFDAGNGHALYASSDNVYLVKLDGDGGLTLWARSMSGPGRDVGEGVTIAANGDVVVVGEYQQTLNDGMGGRLNSDGGYDCFLARWTAQGTYNRHFRGYRGDGDCVAADVVTDAQGNAFIAGKFSDQVVFDLNDPDAVRESQTGYNAFLLKVSAGGDYQWVADMGGDGGGLALPGRVFTRSSRYIVRDQPGDARANGVGVDGAGRVYVAGHFQDHLVVHTPGGGSHVVGQSDPFMGFVTKFSTNGAYLGPDDAAIAEAGGSGAAYLFDLAVDSAGNYAVTGSSSIPTLYLPDGSNLVRRSSADVTVMRYDSAGHLVSARNFGNSGSNTGYAVDLNEAGDLALAGRFWTTIQVDDAHTLQSYGGYDAFFALLHP